MFIIPAILPRDWQEIEAHVARVRHVPWVQIDLCDGIFVPSQTWPYVQGGWSTVNTDLELPFWQDVNYEFDLMVSNPVAVVDTVMELGAMRAVLHVGSASHEEILKALRALEHYDMEAVLAIDNTVPLEELFALLEKGHQVHAVQCMGIAQPGYQNQTFDARVLERIADIRTRAPHLTISVDGSVNIHTLPDLIRAGANRFVSGSAVFGSGDALEAIQQLENICHNVTHDETTHR